MIHWPLGWARSMDFFIERNETFEKAQEKKILFFMMIYFTDPLQQTFHNRAPSERKQDVRYVHPKLSSLYICHPPLNTKVWKRILTKNGIVWSLDI